MKFNGINGDQVAAEDSVIRCGYLAQRSVDDWGKSI